MIEGILGIPDLGWRTLVVGVIACLIIYILLLVLRMVRLSQNDRHPSASSGIPNFESIRQARIQPYLDGAGKPSPQAGNPLFVPDEPDLAWREPPRAFAEQQVQAALERQVEQLREEVDGLREAFSALREDMLKDLAALRSQQGIAAFYRDAMSLAASGRPAEDIAERCGIARAEADLVIALAQAREKKTDDGENYG